MHRSLALACLSLIAVPAAAQAASPATLPTLTKALKAPAAARHDCATTNARRGVTRARYVAPMSGFVTARLGSARGDWDLIARDAATRNNLATSQGFGSNEVVQTWARAGQRIDFIVCRRKGSDATAALRIAFVDVKPPSSLGTVSLVRVTGDSSKIGGLEKAGLDVTHERGQNFADVLVAGEAQRKLIADSGLDATTRVADMTAFGRASDRTDATRAATGSRSALPSGRETYRTYEDVQTELKALVEKHPDSVRPVVIGKTFQGRDIQGVEIADNVNADDGRPTFFLMGLHHAREWPSEEAAMEYATMLADPNGDARVSALRANERTVIVPVVNVDGFVTTRQDSAVDPNDNNPAGQDPNVHLGESVAPPGGILAYRRKNCDGEFPNPNVPCELQWGIDNNRNYGNLWGGPGSSQDPTSQSFHGPGPRSEPETQAVWNYARTHQVTFLMTLHNVAALVLRPPGLHDGGKAPDEARMKEIGDAMANATGYTSEFGFQLYDTAGTTEDDTYAATGAYGYTIEIGPEGGDFHMPYETGVVNEWTGKNKKAATHGGMREALLIAADAAANPVDHATLRGNAPAGSVLHLTKTFDTKTSDYCPLGIDPALGSDALPDLAHCPTGNSPALTLKDKLDLKTVVPASGRFDWAINQSTRPFVNGGSIKETIADQPYKQGKSLDGSSGEHTMRFDVSPEDAQNAVKVNLAAQVPADDYAVYVYKVNADGSRGKQVASSATGSASEEAVMSSPEAGTYEAEVDDYTAVTDAWTLSISYFVINREIASGTKEAYTLTCEDGQGKVLDLQSLVIDRGQNVALNLCGATGALGDAATAPSTAPSKAKPKKTSSKKAQARTRCRSKAKRIKSARKRKAALRRCDKP